MCRLFGLSAAPERVHATFWLLEAPDSLAEQSRREPDGTGLGVFDEHGAPVVRKQPIAAYRDAAFGREAQEFVSQTFLAHIRYASTGGLSAVNTHPFTQHGRLFAHNGVLGDLERLDAELGEYRALVAGDTDSERLFALITMQIEAHDGDVGAGIAAGGPAGGGPPARRAGKQGWKNNPPKHGVGGAATP
ncbi:class II glutamine amidotransferase, partial [Nocardia farcinica]|uniref:class II glutamine amidotransferase n=1 Tax=Nocardia farcinica TaxID=37329 RepID=UPI0024542E4D